MASKWARVFVKRLARMPKDRAELAEIVTAVQMSALEAQRDEIRVALDRLGPAFDAVQERLEAKFGG